MAAPDGQPKVQTCTRKGQLLDGGLHHLFGAAPKSEARGLSGAHLHAHAFRLACTCIPRRLRPFCWAGSPRFGNARRGNVLPSRLHGLHGQHGLPCDDPNHLGVRCNALPRHQMTRITSGYGATRSLGIKWPKSPPSPPLPFHCSIGCSTSPCTADYCSIKWP